MPKCNHIKSLNVEICIWHHPTALPRTGMSLVFTVGSRQRWIHVKCRRWMPHNRISECSSKVQKSTISESTKKCSKPTQEISLGVMKPWNGQEYKWQPFRHLHSWRCTSIWYFQKWRWWWPPNCAISSTCPKKIPRIHPNSSYIFILSMYSPIELSCTKCSRALP